MNSLPPALLAACLVLLLASPGTDPEVAQDTGPRQVSAEPDGSNPGPAHAPRQRADAPPQARRSVLSATLEPRPPDEAQDAVIRRYCVRCHNDRRLRGNLSLESFQTASAYQNAEVAEKMIRKLRAAMMPPPRSPRPGGDTLQALVELLEISGYQHRPRAFKELMRILDSDTRSLTPTDTESLTSNSAAIGVSNRFAGRSAIQAIRAYPGP